MKKDFSWYFALTCSAYVPIACDMALRMIIDYRINFWLVTLLAFFVCLLIFIMVYNVKNVLLYYSDGASSFYLAKENLNSVFAVLAAAGALVDYVLTSVIMAIYFAYSVEGIFNSLRNTVLLSVCILFLAALITYKKWKINLSFIKIFSILFLTLLFSAIIFVYVEQVSKNDIFPGFNGYFLEIKENDIYYVNIFIIYKLFSCLAVNALGFNSIKLSNSLEKEEKKYTGIYRTAFLVCLLMCSVLYLGQNLGINPTDTHNTIYQIVEKVAVKEIFSIISFVFIAVVMFISTCTVFALLPSLCEELAQYGYFPSMFKNSKDSFMYLNGIFITLFLTVAIILISKCDIKTLFGIYALGAFLSLSIGQLALFFKTDTKKKKIMAFLGSMFSFINVVLFAGTKFINGAWIVMVFIFVLAVFMLLTKKYYIILNAEMKLEKDKNIGRLNKRSTSIIIITDMDRGILPAVIYAKAISKDCRAVFVSSDENEEKQLAEDWELYFPDIPLVVLKNKENNNVIKPILKYIELSEKSINLGIITVVIPEYIPKKAIYAVFHRNYAFLLKTILGFRKGIVTISVPYWSDR